MKMPELEDFGVTPEQYAHYIRKGIFDRHGDSLLSLIHIASSIISVAVVVLVVIETTANGTIAFWSAIGSLIFVAPILTVILAFLAYLIDALIGRYKSWRILKGPIVSRIKQYEEAQAVYNVVQAEALKAQQEADRQREEAERQQREAERARRAVLLAQQRKREQYWKSLGGIEFERELGKLFTARGYDVRHTGGSGDQGGDLILRKDGETTVVQCKAWKNPATPQVARELGGSMMHYKADNGILACTGGFSAGVLEFARGKPITLIDAGAISRMAAESGNGMQDLDESPPVCPIHGCGSDMVLRNGRYGSFWGCPRYPACQGRKSLRAAGSLFQ